MSITEILVAICTDEINDEEDGEEEGKSRTEELLLRTAQMVASAEQTATGPKMTLV